MDGWQVLAETRRARAAGDVSSTTLASFTPRDDAQLPGSAENQKMSRLANAINRIMHKKHRQAKDMGVKWQPDMWNPRG